MLNPLESLSALEACLTQSRMLPLTFVELRAHLDAIKMALSPAPENVADFPRG